MAKAVILPRQGNTVESCILLSWRKKKGDKIKKGDILCEVETDKAVFEIEAEEEGTLLELFFEEGDDIPVLTHIAAIGEEGEDYENLRPAQTDIPEQPQESPVNLPAPETGHKESEEKIPVTEKTSNNRRGVSPRARQLAKKHGISLSGIQGSGPMGRVIERDVLNVMQIRQPLTPAAREAVLVTDAPLPAEGSGLGGRITRQDVLSSSQAEPEKDIVREEPLKGVRKIISERMLASLQNSAQLTLHRSADASALLALRAGFKKSALNHPFASVNINDLVMFAVIKILPNHPVINSLLNDYTVKYYKNIHLGFAVDTKRGLIVPTVKNAQNFDLLSLSKEIKRLTEACRNNRIHKEDLSPATFTVTNLGSFGIESFTPVLNLPQNAILGLNAIHLKPVQTEAGVEFTPHIGLSLTINHQVIDGAAGTGFLQELAEAIKNINILVAI
ncbi:MAG TPA: 2-oxo acid dehydrogenase subunit E2 [Caldithrix abyssi]|uniref:Dihydrolipoamide acetyltransferase component of pyruvate dehydrogenase complex n=1 Tax=Caldithrix abyssi TaxID=187145 RepID=A0A7V4TZT7_CALAY|nr:2-oxo acid dehydrogenase subunit E2 [Caldithrix abyssi]